MIGIERSSVCWIESQSAKVEVNIEWKTLNGSAPLIEARTPNATSAAT